MLGKRYKRYGKTDSDILTIQSLDDTHGVSLPLSDFPAPCDQYIILIYTPRTIAYTPWNWKQRVQEEAKKLERLYSIHSYAIIRFSIFNHNTVILVYVVIALHFCRVKSLWLYVCIVCISPMSVYRNTVSCTPFIYVTACNLRTYIYI